MSDSFGTNGFGFGTGSGFGSGPGFGSGGGFGKTGAGIWDAMEQLRAYLRLRPTLVTA